jgi:hypothetical protein
MISVSKFLLVLGILLTAGGVAGTGYFYRQMKVENLKHARTGDIPLTLGRAGEWQSADFNVFREGTHTIALAVEHRGPARTSPGRYHGGIEIEVTDPDGAVMFRGSAAPEIGAFPPAGSTRILTVDSFAVARVSEAPWRIRARIASPDTAFAQLSAELSVFPPQLYDIEEYLSGRIVTLISMGAMAVAGFVTVVFSAHLRRRAADAPPR